MTRRLLVVLALMAFVNAQVAPIVPDPAVTNRAQAILKGQTFTATYDVVGLEKGFADGVFQNYRWYQTNYSLVASNFDAAQATIRSLDKLRGIDSNYTQKLEDTLAKTQKLLDSALEKVRTSRTAGEVLLGVGVLIGVVVVVAAVLLAAQLAKSLGITLGATVPK